MFDPTWHGMATAHLNDWQPLPISMGNRETLKRKLQRFSGSTAKKSRRRKNKNRHTREDAPPQNNHFKKLANFTLCQSSRACYFLFFFSLSRSLSLSHSLRRFTLNTIIHTHAVAAQRDAKRLHTVRRAYSAQSVGIVQHKYVERAIY